MYESLQYNEYGCWCGENAKDEHHAVDALDGACRALHHCYDKHPCIKHKGSRFFDGYRITCVHRNVASFSTPYRRGTEDYDCVKKLIQVCSLCIYN